MSAPNPEQPEASFSVDLAVVLEKLKTRFAARIADLEHECSLLSTALDSVQEERARLQRLLDADLDKITDK